MASLALALEAHVGVPLLHPSDLGLGERLDCEEAARDAVVESTGYKVFRALRGESTQGRDYQYFEKEGLPIIPWVPRNLARGVPGKLPIFYRFSQFGTLHHSVVKTHRFLFVVVRF